MIELLKELCTANGVTGFEREAALLCAEKIKKSCDKLYLDKIGNLIAFKKGRKRPPKTVMYCAHLDEVGMMIKHINGDGTLLFDSVGIMPDVLPSKHVAVGRNKIPGVICSKPVHLSDGGKTAENMYIDIGAYSAEEAEKLGVYADYAAFAPDFEVFGGGKLVRSKAIDDRFGCLMLIKLADSDLEYDSYFVFTVGEEVGGVGAVAAANSIRPDAAFIFESTTASDIPSNAGADRVCSLGDGAVVPFMDGGTVYDRELYRKIRRIADENGIKTQTKSRVAGGTDAASIQRSIDGVKTAAVSLACRYIHTSSCVASADDMAECLKLAAAIDRNLGFLLED